jgi:hypothetical protein
MLAIAARFSTLLGLALWIGIPVAVLVQSRIIGRNLAKPQTQDLMSLLIPSFDRLLLVAFALVLVGQAMSVSLSRTLPPGHQLMVLGSMVGLRLIGAFAISAALRALRLRVREPNVTESDRRAFTRLYGTSHLLIGVEAACAILFLFQTS